MLMQVKDLEFQPFEKGIQSVERWGRFTVRLVQAEGWSDADTYYTTIRDITNNQELCVGCLGLFASTEEGESWLNEEQVNELLDKVQGMNGNPFSKYVWTGQTKEVYMARKEQQKHT
jgi:hypothetical protein